MNVLNVYGEMSTGVSVLFHYQFRTMEDDGNLNCLDEVDMFCLHYALLLIEHLKVL